MKRVNLYYKWHTREFFVQLVDGRVIAFFNVKSKKYAQLDKKLYN